MAVHYCGETVVKTAIDFGIPDGMGCGMEAEQDKNNCKFPVFDATSCCKDQITKLSIDTEYNNSHASLKLDNYGVVHLPVYLNLSFPNITTFYKKSNFYRSPPDINGVILTFIQVFII